MLIHINLIAIGMMTIIVPALYYNSPNANIIMSTILFMSGIYLTGMYFLMLYYKDSKEKSEKEKKELLKELEALKVTS